MIHECRTLFTDPKFLQNEPNYLELFQTLAVRDSFSRPSRNHLIGLIGPRQEPARHFTILSGQSLICYAPPMNRSFRRPSMVTPSSPAGKKPDPAHPLNALLYYDLINCFDQLTGCPVLVNTSFNVRSEPIVCTPEDAFRCFMGTEIDMLVAGNCVLRKEQQDPGLKRNYEDTFEPG